MKGNLKSIRLSDEVYNYINNYKGDGFNQKFENIVLFAMRTEADRKKEIAQLDKEISNRKSILYRLQNELYEVKQMKEKVSEIETLINRFIKQYQN